MRFDELSDRRNIIVIADEAHRTQYGFDAKIRIIKDGDGNEIDAETTYGFAKHMHDALPNATFIGFTGTPVESTDKNTKAVFGEYVDIYDIERAVRDGATVPIYYENRFVKLKLDQLVMNDLDEKLNQAAEGKPEYIVNQAIEKATRQEAIIGKDNRLAIIATDIAAASEQISDGVSGIIVPPRDQVALAAAISQLYFNPEMKESMGKEGAKIVRRKYQVKEMVEKDLEVLRSVL